MKRIFSLLLSALLIVSLCACGADKAGDTPQSTGESGEGAYCVYVVDADGEPISGVKIQFCDDTTCRIGTTDEDGMAAFAIPEGEYSVQVLTAPEGYAVTEEEIEAPPQYGDMRFTLQKAA